MNRLLQKHPRAKQRGEIPQVSRSFLNVSAESWSLEKLWNLIHPEQFTDVEPNVTNLPVIVLRWNGTDYLMDGRRRINRWKRNESIGPHRVLLVHQCDDA
jgi:hypothetical protein